MVIETLISLILSGGATGLFGTGLSRYFNYLDKAQEQKFMLQKYKLDAETRVKVADSEQAIALSASQTDMLTASFKHDSSLGQGSQWVVNILRLVRPTLTLLLWTIVLVIWVGLMNDIEKAVETPWLAKDALVMKEQIIATVLYSATAATLWWFGTRDMRKK